MKAFMILDAMARPIAVAADRLTAENLMFTMAMDDGLADEEAGTFDFGGLNMKDVDMQGLREGLLLTEEEIHQLDEEGAVLL